jgi:hypothetical protein
MKSTFFSILIGVLSLSTASMAKAAVGMGVRVGTLGYGADLDIALSKKFNVRLGYSAFSIAREIEDTDVVYDGDLKLSNASLVIDWHPFASGFRLSLGAMGPGLSVDVVGKPTGGTYEIGDGVYTASQIGAVSGQLKWGNTASPYIGLGWGNVPSKNHRVTFLFDLGAIYAGKPTATITASPNCAGLTAPQCANLTTRLQSDVALEQREFESDASELQWWPVVQIGLGVRF